MFQITRQGCSVVYPRSLRSGETTDLQTLAKYLSEQVSLWNYTGRCSTLGFQNSVGFLGKTEYSCICLIYRLFF